MGYNYKTTDPQDIDYMSSLPANYMLQAQQVADTANDAQINQTDLLGNSVAHVNYLPQDADKVKAAQDRYDQQISSTVNNIMQDPANYRQHMPAIRTLTRNITDDMTNGELGSYMKNANAFQTWDTENHKKVVDGKVDPLAYQTMRTSLLKNFQDQGGTNWNPNTKVGNTISTEDMMATPDINKKIQDATDKIKANSSDWSRDQTNGQWIFTNKSKNEQVEASRVANVALETLISDPEVAGYLKQGSKYGYLQGAYNSDGTLVQPYSIDKHGNPIWNPKSMLAAPIAAAVGRDSYKKVDSEQAMKDNPYGVKAYEFQHEEKMLGLKQAYDDASAQTANDLKMKGEREMAILHTALGAGTTEQAVLDKLMGGSSANHIVASPDGTTTISPFAGMDKNPDGSPRPITSDAVNNVLLPASYTKIADLTAKTKDPNLTANQRGLFQQQLDEEKANADKLANYSSSAHDYAIDQLKNKGISLEDLNKYYLYKNNAGGVQDKYNASLNKVNQDLSDLTNPEYTKAMNTISGAKNGVQGIDPYTDMTKAKSLINQRDNLQKATQKFQDTGKAISDGESSWFENNRKTTNVNLNGVGLNVDNKNLVYNAMKTNPQGVQVRDLNTDNTPETKLAQQEIQKVIAKGENLSDYLDITKVNAPVAGVGTTITATLKPHSGWVSTPMNKLFVHDSFNNNPYNKTILITLPDNVTHALGTNMANNGSTASEKNMGGLINSNAESATLSAIQNHMSDDKGNVYGTASIYDNQTRQVHNIRVQPNMASGTHTPQSYSATVDDGKGNYVPFNYTYTNDKGQAILDPSTHKPITTNEFPNEKALNDALYGHLKYNQ